MYDEKNKMIKITKEQLEKDEHSDKNSEELKTKIGSSIDKDIVLLGDFSSCCHDQNSDHDALLRLANDRSCTNG